MMQEGLPVSIALPVGVSLPVAESTVNATIAVEIGRVKQAPSRIETEEPRGAAAC